MFNSNIYQQCPIFIQNLSLSLRALARKLMREGKSQLAVLKIIKYNEYDPVTIKEFSDSRLTSVLEKAKADVPFYKGDVKDTPVDLAEFSLISKFDVKDRADDFLVRSNRGIFVTGTTSGTTGTPLAIKQSMESIIREQAFVARHLEWAGFAAGDRRAWIRGDMIVPLNQKKAPFWRYSYFENMIMLSSFHMSQQHLSSYIKAMADFDTQIIQAYPSSIVTLAKYLDANDLYYPGVLKSIVTSSESLAKEDKILVEKRFKCTVFDWYGLFERVAAIASCEYGRYHILTDYSHVELVPAGKTEDGKDRAEIVGTNFNNSLYPLIRYKTGDHVILSEDVACPCGRVFPIVDSIEGRVGDYLVAEDGQKVHILNHIPKGVNGLLGTQFIQKELMKIEVLVTCNSDFIDSERLKLITNIKERLGHKMEVTITVVDDFIRTKNGKMRQAICELQR